MSDINHFIIASLNLKPDQIKSLDTVELQNSTQGIYCNKLCKEIGSVVLH